MPSDFPVTASPCSLHQGEPRRLDQWLDFAFEKLHGAGPTTNEARLTN